MSYQSLVPVYLYKYEYMSLALGPIPVHPFIKVTMKWNVAVFIINDLFVQVILKEIFLSFLNNLFYI